MGKGRTIYRRWGGDKNVRLRQFELAWKASEGGRRYGAVHLYPFLGFELQGLSECIRKAILRLKYVDTTQITVKRITVKIF